MLPAPVARLFAFCVSLLLSMSAHLAAQNPSIPQALPANSNVCENANATFTVAGSTGSGTLSYQWYAGNSPGGIPLTSPSAFTDTLTLTGVTSNDSGNEYYCVVTDSVGSAASRAAILTVDFLHLNAPAVTSFDNCVGTTFSVTLPLPANSTGVAPLTYQWYGPNGVLTGKTGRLLTLNNVQLSDSGNYYCKVRNGTNCGPGGSATEETSVNVALHVNRIPVVTMQSTTPQDICELTSFSLTVGANGGDVLYPFSGNLPFTYAWNLGGVPLSNGGAVSGADTAVLTIHSMSASYVGSYTCTVSNTCGSSTSSGAVINLRTRPVVTQQPNNQTVCPNYPGAVTSNLGNGEAVFTVAVSGTPAPTIQWQFNGGGGFNDIVDGTEFSGTTTNTLTVHDLLYGEGRVGTYRVKVTNVCSTVYSNAGGQLAVNQQVAITTQPAATPQVCVGSSITLSVAGTGTGLSYQWKKGAANVGTNSPNFTIVSAVTGDAGTYTCEVSGTCEPTVTSSASVLTVNELPAIATQPEAAPEVCQFGTKVLSVGATGAGLTYQWQKNGSNISGATAASYTISNAALTDAGSYRVVVSGTCTPSVTSNAAVLVVNVAPAITSQPQGSAVCEGTSTTLSTTASGSAPLSYQWSLNGNAISGATLSQYTVASMAAGNVGSYVCRVSNMCTFADTTPTSLSLNTTPVLTGPSAQSICPTVSVGNPHNAVFSVSATGVPAPSFQWKKDGLDLVDGGNISGANSSTLTVSGVVAADAGSYSCVATNVCGSDTESAQLTVKAPTSISTQPLTQTTCPGATHPVTLSVVAAGSGALSYQWRFNGNDITGATASSYSIGSPSSVHQGSYTCVVTAADCSSDPLTSSAAVLTVRAPTLIGTHPVTQTTCPGATHPVTLSVAATGAGTLSYQWQFDGTDISGATLSSYSIASPSSADQGSYTCVVRASDCSTDPVTSNAGVLTVRAPTLIGTHPVTQTTCPGVSHPVTLTVAATGSGTLSYQWQFNGTDIASATLSSYQIASPSSADQGSYTCVVRASDCSTDPVTSNAGVLTVRAPTVVGTHPLTQTTCPGATHPVTLTVAATGSGALSYQWRLNGTDIAGATSASYSIAAPSAANAGVYRCAVTSADCSTDVVLSNPALLSVLAPTLIATQPLTQTTCPGASHPITLTVGASGSGTLSFQWRFNGFPIGLATSQALSIPAPTESDEGSYTCDVWSSDCPSDIVTTMAAVLTVNPPTEISTQPATQSTCPGSNHPVTLSVVASGSSGVTYQWKFNGNNISGATASSYSIAAPVEANEGSYTCVVRSQDCASDPVTSQPAVLTVHAETVVNTHPVAASVCPGPGAAHAATFSVSASGEGTLSYQWKKGGSALSDGGKISGATASSLTITGVTAADAGQYTCTVTSSVCSGEPATSNAAQLTVYAETLIGTQPVSMSSCPGNSYSASFSVVATGQGTLSYQWQKNGVPMSNGGRVSGANSASLSISQVQSGDAANYTCVVLAQTCNNDPVTSSAGTLTVHVPAAITGQSNSDSIALGQPLNLSVTTVGSPAPTYQWRKGSSQIPGATNASYTIAALAMTDSGNYFCDVTNVCGTVSTTAITISVVDVGDACYVVGSQPNSVIAANLDANAGNELIVSNEGGNSVKVLVNDGKGVMKSPFAPVQLGGAPRGLTAGDWDGDGDLDVAVAIPGQGRVVLLINNGSGNLSLGASIVTGGVPVTVAALTQKNATYPDLVVCDFGSFIVPGNIYFLANAGNASGTPGTFGAPTSLKSGGLFADLAVGDLDGDNRPDIVAANSSSGATRGVHILMGGAGGSFSDRSGSPFNVGRTPETVALGDLNADGLLDIATTTAVPIPGPAGISVLYSSAGNLVLHDAVQIPALSVSIGNADGTGKPDLAFARLNGTISVVHGYNAGSSPDGIETRATPTGVTRVLLTPISLANTCGGVDLVSISNASGSLCVTQPRSVTIGTQPVAATKCAGQSVSFSVTAFGGIVGYQWRKDGIGIPGATSDSYTIASVATTDAANYDCVIDSDCAAVTTSTAALTVRVVPTVTTDPTGGVRCEGQAFTFTAAASGSTPFSYQWRKGGSNITGATNSSLALSGLLAADSGSYDCMITNNCGSATTASASLEVRVAVTFPTQPANQLGICSGTSASFTVVAAGTAPFTYQWRKNGSAISGATAATYSIASVATGDAGSYDCLVNNYCTTSPGVATSAAQLTVDVAPTVTNSVPATTVCTGTTASFSVSSTGTPAPSYQWRRNGNAISGATSASYSFTASAANDGDTFDCTVTNHCGTQTSTATTLTVRVPPTVTTDPVAGIRCEGQAYTFTAAATGSTPISYQWRKGGSNITGATNSSLPLTGLLAADSGSYDCVITNNCGSATTAAASLEVRVAVTIASHPAAQLNICSGTSASFTVAANGTAPFTYQWRKNGSDISGATAATYSIASVATTDAGSYDCLVSNYCSTTGVASNAAQLTVDVAPAVTSSPADRTVCSTTSTTFTVVATGTPAPTYQWYLGTTSLTGETSASLTIASVSTANAGAYKCVVTNHCGNAESVPANLTVDVAPTVSSPSNATVCENTTASFSVTATGTPAPSYQWVRNGQDISGATSASYSFTAVAADHGATFACRVTNHCGSATSATAAVLSVDLNPTVTTQPTAQSICSGDPVTFTVAASGKAPFTYQWQKNGSNIGGANAASFTIASVATGDAGTYRCIVTNACTSTPSSGAQLSVRVAPAITLQPVTSQTVCLNAVVSFTVAASGTPAPDYQWRFGGVNIAGATSATFTIPAAQSADAGSYTCMVSNSCGNVESSTSTLQVTVNNTLATNCYSTAAAPVRAIAGDADGVNGQDLLVSVSGGVQLLLNDGNGNLVAQPVFPSGSGTAGLASADFDGDGKLDVAVANTGSGTVSVIYGNGTGGYYSTATVLSGGQPVAVAAVATGSHTRADLVIADRSGSLKLAENNANTTAGDRTFGIASAVAGVTGTIVDVAAGDVSGATSRAEIVAIDSAGGLVHVIDAATMAPVAGSPFSTVATPNSCTLVDVNADGKLDIAVAGAGGVNVNLSPLFSLDTVALSSAASSSIVTGNLNGQAKPDFAWLSASSDLVVAYGYNVGAAPDRMLSGNCLLQGDALVSAHLSPIGTGGASPCDTDELGAIRTATAQVCTVRFRCEQEVAPVPASGCPPPYITAGASGTPTIGNTSFALTLSGAVPFSYGATLAQLNPAGSTPTPTQIDPSVPCYQIFDLSQQILQLFTLTNAVGSAATLMPIPNNPALIALELRSQWLVLDGVGPLFNNTATLSNGLVLRIGEF